MAPRSGDVAGHFAADAGSASLAVGHHALGGGDDGNAQAVLDLRDVVAALVHTQTRLGHALDLLDHGTAGIVLQGDFQRGLRSLAGDLESVNVALVLQDLGDRDFQL